MRFFSTAVLSALFASIIVLPFHGMVPERVFQFAEAIDAVSIGFTSEEGSARLSYRTDDGWSAWTDMSVENEQDPALRESNLLMLPKGVTHIRVRSDDTNLALHPITVDDSSASIEVAATSAIVSPKILTRKQWGADESLRFRTGSSTSTNGTNADDNGSAGNLTQREKDCEIAQVNYPEDFRTPPADIEENGQRLRWANRYSTQVKLLVVHHTAQSMDGETRSGIERMRALYQYHAGNRGWGDIGYHYVIDDQGKIYEGKAGGDFVVGGHAYCNNVGTIGVAMMGNFDESKPPQVQMQALQWLLQSLAARYKIAVDEAVQYHGKRLPAIVGHKQLLQTDCPGEYVWRTLGQVRTHVASGDVDNPILFPNPERSTTPSPVRRILPTVVQKEGFESLGSTTIEGRPGGEIIIPVLYYAGKKSVREGQRISTLWRSNRDLRFWQERGGIFKTATRTLVSPADVRAGDSVLVRIKVRLPLARGSTTFRIGSLTYTLNLSGRTARGQLLSTTQAYARPTTVADPSSPSLPAYPQTTPSTAANSAPIRIQLNDTTAFETVTLRTNGSATINGTDFAGQMLTLGKDGSLCTASENGRTIQRSILQIVPDNGQTTLTSWQKPLNRFRGVIECRIIDGKLTLINELPLEDYMAGLAEEPDTEPYEKQRAFAIAARTYAAWYMEDDHRKFPGKPYDGSDNPAAFQVYGGLVFEEKNPRWVEAVRSTAGKTLRFGGQLIKPPYFSSDDGKTRSPADIGWKNFPFEAIFQSKPDPWCAGMENRGHGVGMSGCGAEAQAREGKKAEEILQYYYPGTDVQ